MKKHKLVLIVLLFFPILVFAGEIPGLYRLNINPSQAVINTGESIRINVDAWAYGGNVANEVVIDMGNGDIVDVDCQSDGHNCSGSTAPVTYKFIQRFIFDFSWSLRLRISVIEIIF